MLSIGRLPNINLGRQVSSKSLYSAATVQIHVALFTVCPAEAILNSTTDRYCKALFKSMGVRGLTTFIAKQANKYLENYQLHDTYLVIDGNNIASHIYKWHCTRNDCFGGDYDKYAKIVLDFFKLLKDCNVTPVVVFDGGYEDKKLRTVYSRLKNKVRVSKNLNSVTQGSITMFPLFMRDVFVDIVLKLGVKAVRCDFEADYEMACLARSLNCPLLSYDSDFYVFDVLYIPFSSFEMSLHKVRNSSPSSFRIHCRLYRIENFLKMYGGLSKSNLPLIATLLGNDYINKSVFKGFYNHIKLPKRKHVRSDQQRKIASVLKWMQHETYDSAVKKILGRLKTERRKYVSEQIRIITEGYVCKTSKYFQYLNIQINESTESVEINFEAILNSVNVEPENDVDDGTTSSDSSESDSESSDSSLAIPESSKEVCSEIGPDWFLENFRKCQYPSPFVDILIRNKYFCIPQLEDYSNTCSHHISAVILSAISKILTSGNAETLTYVARNENAKIQHYMTPPCTMKLPTLEDVKDIKCEYAKNILLDVLEINSKNVVEFLNDLPASWHLYVLGIIYWIKNAKPKVAYCHVYSVVLCMLVISKVDAQIGYCRSSSKFFNRFESKLKLLASAQEESKNVEISKTNFVELLKSINYDDCLLCMKELIKYFQMEEKMANHLKLFDIQILDCYAQFQSCLLHISYLNKLLNKPFTDLLISDFYDGTFLYNMCVNLMKRNEVEAYLDMLLKNSLSILNCFKTLINIFVKILSGDIISTTTGKRRRKKKKNNVQNVTVDDVYKDESESGSENVMDVNNRFSLLNLIK